MLRRRIATELLGPGATAKLALTLLTFGFKNGPPRDADLVLRRPLPAQPALPRGPAAADRPRPEVVEHVEAGELASEFYERLLPLLDFLLPAYVAEGKTHLTIAIGCTGGRHRSVTVADRIARHLAGRDDLALRVVHRDVELDCSRAPDLESPPMPEPVISVRACASPTATSRRCAGIDLEVRPRRGLRLPGPQRRRQDDHGRDPRGLPRAQRGRGHGARRRPGARRPASWRERIGIVLQQCRMRPELTVRETLELYAGYYREPRSVDETIEHVGLAEKADERAGQPLGRPAAPARRRASR